MKRFFYLSILLVFAACAMHKNKQNPTANSSIVSKDEIIEETPSTRSSAPTVYQATETVFTDIIHTRLEVNFDWAKSRMNGIATITAKPHFYRSDSLILDAKGMDILSVQLNAKNLAYTYDSAYLRIQLDRKYSRDENYTVQLKYVAKPNERITSTGSAITSDKGLYFINPTGEEKNKMPQIWTQGETEASSVWFPTIDSPNIKTTQEIFMTVDNKYTTLSNGKLISSKKQENGMRTDHWKQDLPHSPYLFMMAVGEFKEVKDSYTRPDGSKMEVNYYVEPAYEAYAKDIFGETPNMLKFFSQLLGVEYPWDKYSQIVVRDYVSGAMENTSATVFGDYVYRTDRELLDENNQSTIAHELFHHWFGDLVTAESWSNLPLNESFANYSQYLWDEYRYGLDAADLGGEKDADGYYQSSQMNGYHNLIWFGYEQKDQMFDAHSYNKGGRILHMLRNYLGDEAFFKGLNVYLTTNKFKAAEYNQLRLAFEEVSGQDLNWFFNQWFLASAHPILDINQQIDTKNNTVSITIQQKQNLELAPLFKLPVDIAVYDSLGKHVHKVVIDQLTQTVEFPFSGTLLSVVFDDQQMLLAKVREEKPTNQYIYQYYNGKRYRTRLLGLQLGTKVKTPEAQQLVLDALKDPFWKIRMTAIEKSNKLSDEYKKASLKIIESLALADSNSSVRAMAINTLSSTLDAKNVEPLLSAAIDNDKSYLVASSALRNLSKINPDLAMRKAKSLESTNASSILVSIAQVYGSFGKEGDFSFFENTLKGSKLNSQDQLITMNSLTYYITRQSPETLGKSVEIYSYLAEKGGTYTQLFMPQNIRYIMSMIDTRMTETTNEISEYEKSNKPQYANELRKKLELYNDLKKKFKVLEDIK